MMQITIFLPPILPIVKGNRHTVGGLYYFESPGEPLYERYRFDEPWNGPHNRKLEGGLPVGMSGIVLGITVRLTIQINLTRAM